MPSVTDSKPKAAVHFKPPSSSSFVAQPRHKTSTQQDGKHIINVNDGPYGQIIHDPGNKAPSPIGLETISGFQPGSNPNSSRNSPTNSHPSSSHSHPSSSRSSPGSSHPSSSRPSSSHHSSASLHSQHSSQSHTSSRHSHGYGQNPFNNTKPSSYNSSSHNIHRDANSQNLSVNTNPNPDNNVNGSVQPTISSTKQLYKYQPSQHQLPPQSTMNVHRTKRKRIMNDNCNNVPSFNESQSMGANGSLFSKNHNASTSQSLSHNQSPSSMNQSYNSSNSNSYGSGTNIHHQPPQKRRKIQPTSGNHPFATSTNGQPSYTQTQRYHKQRQNGHGAAYQSQRGPSGHNGTSNNPPYGQRQTQQQPQKMAHQQSSSYYQAPQIIIRPGHGHSRQHQNASPFISQRTNSNISPFSNSGITTNPRASVQSVQSLPSVTSHHSNSSHSQSNNSFQGNMYNMQRQNQHPTVNKLSASALPPRGTANGHGHGPGPTSNNYQNTKRAKQTGPDPPKPPTPPKPFDAPLIDDQPVHSLRRMTRSQTKLHREKAMANSSASNMNLDVNTNTNPSIDEHSVTSMNQAVINPGSTTINGQNGVRTVSKEIVKAKPPRVIMTANRSRRIKKQNSRSPPIPNTTSNSNLIIPKKKRSSKNHAILTGTNKISTQLCHETRDKYAALKSTTIPFPFKSGSKHKQELFYPIHPSIHSSLSQHPFTFLFCLLLILVIHSSYTPFSYLIPQQILK